MTYKVSSGTLTSAYSLDGSRTKSSSLSAAGLYMSTENVKIFFPLGKFCSVFHAELYAILQCARHEECIYCNLLWQSSCSQAFDFS